MDARLRDLLAEFVRLLQKEFEEDLVSVVLYGSVARGTATKDSDVDLLVVCRNLPDHPWDRNSRIHAIEEELQPKLEKVQEETGWFPYLSILMRTPEEAAQTSRTYFDMVEEAVLLVDRDDFFQKVLDQIAARMKELGSRKIVLDEGWYWDLKPDLTWGEVFEI